MHPDGLLRLCREISEIDRSRFSDCTVALDWFAERLHYHTGADVIVWLAEFVGGELPTAIDSSAWLAGAPVVPRVKSFPLRELKILDKPVDVADDALFLESIHDGPKVTSDLTLAAGERALVFRVRLDFALCGVRVSGSTALLGEPSVWRNWLPIALHGLLRGMHQDRRNRFRLRQEDFFNTLLDTEPCEPSRVFGDLCRAWHDFSGSLWAWLWLYNPISQAFEPIASASDKGINHLDDSLPNHFRPSNKSVAAYVTSVGKVIAVADAAAWRQEYNGQEYKVVAPQLMIERGGRSFVCVPVVATGAARHAAMIDSEIRGAVCLHFDGLASAPAIPFHGLRRMGQATAQAIVNSFMSLHHDILVGLNEMAAHYLAGTGRSPEADREDYLKALIHLLQTRLHFRMVSVFWKVPSQHVVSCLATTGVCRRDGSAVPKDRLAEVRYAAGQGRTGECFATSTPRVFSEKDLGPDAAIGLYYEVDPETKVRGEPFVVQPIPNPGEKEGACPAAGVIRCVSQKKLANRFLQLELEPLKFIARQVGLVLGALESRIRREQTISIVKHDLYSPLTMIRHTVDRLLENAEAGKPPGEYDLADLDGAAYFATNLVSQLELSPNQFGDFEPWPTLLEGDILARVVSMLRPYAWGHRRMRIEFENVRNVIPKLNVDRAMVERAVHNLLVNAVKYGDDRSTIRIEGRKSHAGYCLDIKNDGIGIEPDEVKLIGQRHYRSPKAKSTGMGLGLGLFIARSVMQKHGGNLFLTRPAGPTTFSLFFPVQLAR